jgi:hypothetical protein
MKDNKWIPELVYQDDSPIPFVEVPESEDMPDKLFVWEYKHTGEVEPGPEGEEVPVCSMDIHMYFDYSKAKEILDEEMLDVLRTAFGLEPLKTAAEKGEAITNRVLNATQKEDDDGQQN